MCFPERCILEGVRGAEAGALSYRDKVPGWMLSFTVGGESQSESHFGSASAKTWES